MLINGDVINSAVINGASREFNDLPSEWVSTRYRCYLADLELPISSFQSRLRSNGLSYLSCVVNGVDAYADAINARASATLRVEREYRLIDGTVSVYLMADVTFETLDIYSGARAGMTGNLSGTGDLVPGTAETIRLRNATYYSLSGGRRRYRCELDPRLRPGDTALINGDTLVVDQIVHIVDVRTTTMEISEA